ncbi:MAG: HAMP domain-containing sensor histidine kinase [Patescibacteria group bacterium]
MPSKNSEFKRVLITLTAYYTIGVVIILIVFNFLVYGLFSNSLQLDRKEDSQQSESLDDDNEDGFFDEQNEKIKDDLAEILIISDLIILFLAVFVAYLFSNRTLQPLEETYKKQTRFVADAAHELRTPLSVMQAGSEVMLRSDRSVGEYTKFIEESLDEVKRLTKLSNDLLFLVRSDKKQHRLFEKVNFSEICMKQIENIQSYAQTKNISLHKSVEQDVQVWGLKDDLVRLIVNLLKNAVDYNKEKGDVTVNLKDTNLGAVLTIQDTGIGIKTKDIPHIFDRFYKTDNARKQNSSGTGLGLAIVKGIVEEHEGFIKVKSQFGEGTTFEVILPRT